jgi:hypothetical protein
MGAARASRIWILAACSLALACACAGTASAGTSNICKLAGITKAVGHKVFGRGTRVEYLPQYSPPLCEVIPKNSEYTGSLEVFLSPKSDYSSDRTGITEKGEHVQKVHKLGANGIYVVTRDHSVDDVLFTAGAYTVLIDNNEAGGQSKSVYPTEKQYLTLGEAIRAHLR